MVPTKVNALNVGHMISLVVKVPNGHDWVFIN